MNCDPKFPIHFQFRHSTTHLLGTLLPQTAASLEILSEEAIGEQLQKRFESNQIYTYIGDILVAVNPFTNLGLYSGQHQKRYVGRSRSENPPHIFAVADAAHQVNHLDLRVGFD